MWLEKGIGEEKRWFYPISAFIISAAITVTDLWTMFYPHIQTHFKLEAAASIVLAATFSGLGLMIIGPPIAGTILDKYGPKINFIISVISFISGHSLIMKMLSMSNWANAKFLWYAGVFLVALGTGFFTGTSTATVSKWFPDKLGTVTGIAAAGASFATIVYSRIVASIIKTHGFSGNIFLIFAGISSVVLIGIGIPFWRTPPTDWAPAGMQAKSGAKRPIAIAKDYTFQEALKDKMFWLLCACFTFAAFSSQLFVQNASLIVIEGLSKTMSREEILVSVIPSFVSLCGFAVIAGRFGWGILTDKLGGPWNTLWIVYFLPAVLIAAFYMGYHSKVLIYLIGFLLYFAMYGGTPVVHYAAVPYVFGRKHVGKIMHTLNAISVGIGMALGPYLGAYIKDVTGGYFGAIMLAVIIRLLGTCFALVGLWISKNRINTNKVS